MKEKSHALLKIKVQKGCFCKDAIEEQFLVPQRTFQNHDFPSVKNILINLFYYKESFVQRIVSMNVKKPLWKWFFMGFLE